MSGLQYSVINWKKVGMKNMTENILNTMRKKCCGSTVLKTFSFFLFHKVYLRYARNTFLSYGVASCAFCSMILKMKP